MKSGSSLDAIKIPVSKKLEVGMIYFPRLSAGVKGSFSK